MPELAEVEYYRQQWNSGLRSTIRAVRLHPEKRIFRGLNTDRLEKALPGSRLLKSEAHGKNMLFQFSNDIWLGLHLGLTGELRVEPKDFAPDKHDHLVLYQTTRALVFADSRQFGRVRFHRGPEPPDWWSDLPPGLTSRQFTAKRMQAFLERHRKLSLKPALLLQSGFPGLGNWMVDEILWRARLNPRSFGADLSGVELTSLWQNIRLVCRQAMKNVLTQGYSALPAGWLFHQRWNRKGRCPRDGQPLARATIGGRTTAWCPVCQVSSLVSTRGWV